MIKIPLQSLSQEALDGVIEAYVLREGTDYGHRDYLLAEKVAAVRGQLERGMAEIWYDAATDSTNIREVEVRPGSRATNQGDTN
ncbi:MAG: YheU family protein [Pseudomonadales bacterium]